jgi:hypothetical protein
VEVSCEKQNIGGPKPLYNPVASPAHFSFFPKLKVILKRYKFVSVKERWNNWWSS